MASSDTRRVLVVEDDSGIARMLHISLAAAGFDSVEVENGYDGLELLRREAIDAVILDLVLPDGLGGDILQLLRRPPSSNAPPWVVISALGPAEVASKYGDLGGNFFAKPFDPWALIRRLNDLLQAQGKSTEGAPI